MNRERGSTWNKWDLHLHSPESFHESFGLDRDLDPGEDADEAVWDRYISELGDLDDISCVGITDYFSIEGYERVREAKQNGELDNLDLVLPNIELRVDHFVTGRSADGSSDPIEVHVIFSDDLDPATIEDEFIHNLEAKKPNQEPITPTKDSLIRLGQEAAFDDLTDEDDPYRAGCKLITVDLDTITDALSREEFQGKHLLILEEDGWEKIGWQGRGAALRNGLLHVAEGVFSNSKDTRQWLLGASEDFPEDRFREAFGSLKPGIRGSDTHSFDGFCEPDGDEYCWIKADTTFEGLKQIKYEPKGRVHIGPESPQARMPIQTPDEFQIKDGEIKDTLSIEDKSIPLNTNLITVIGGKGAGKTALLDLLANCYEIQYDEDGKSDVEDSNSFIRRIQNEGSSIKTELSFVGDDIDDFSKEVFTASKIDHSQIEYLPQGQISEVCRDTDEMHDKVLELVLREVRSTDPDLMARFDSQEETLSEHATRLDELTNEIHNHDPGAIDELIEQARSDVEAAMGSLEDIEKQISDFKEGNEGALQDESITEIQDKIDEIDNRLNQLRGLQGRLEDQIERIQEISIFNEELNEVLDLASNLDIELEIDRISIEEREDAITSALDAVEEREHELMEEREEVRSRLDNLEDADEKLSNLRDERRERRDRLNEKEWELDSLQRQKREIEDLREIRREQFVEYAHDVHQYKRIYSIIIGEFLDEKSTILEDVSFSAKIGLDPDLSSNLFELLDGRAVSYPQIEPVENAALNTLDTDEKITHYATEYLDEALKFKDRLRSSSSTLEYERRIFSDIFKLSESILLDETRMEDLSLGQKGTVLLKILLAQGDKPLIIDQPEENLDNKFIYRTLKDAFVEAKKERQVIIATHNANLVVNTDAEQVIVAQYKESEISFTSGALENPDIRNKVTTILEGGERAFIQREEKYGLSD